MTTIVFELMKTYRNLLLLIFFFIFFIFYLRYEYYSIFLQDWVSYPHSVVIRVDRLTGEHCKLYFTGGLQYKLNVIPQMPDDLSIMESLDACGDVGALKSKKK